MSTVGKGAEELVDSFVRYLKGFVKTRRQWLLPAISKSGNGYSADAHYFDTFNTAVFLSSLAMIR